LTLRDNSYYTVGKFFEELSDVDLKQLSDSADAVYRAGQEDSDDDENDHATKDEEIMALLGLGLLLCDGEELNMKNSAAAMNSAVIYTTLESLGRKKLIKPLRQNWAALDSGLPVSEKLE